MSEKLLEFEARKKNLIVAYLLYLFTGLLGTHRLYLGHNFIAAIYTFCTVVLFLNYQGNAGINTMNAVDVWFNVILIVVLLVLGVLDLFTIPHHVEKKNLAIAQEIMSQNV